MPRFGWLNVRLWSSVLAVMAIAACGSAAPTASVAPSPAPSASDPRLVIADLVDPNVANFTSAEARLVKLDGTVTASVKGLYVGMVGSTVIVLQGNSLEAIGRDGSVQQLGQLAVTPEWLGEGTVVVNPQMSEWLYSVRDNASTATVHLGTQTSDRVIATLPSPNGNAFYRPFAWNARGVYMVRQPVGIGGAGPFLEYHFPLAKFDMTTGRATDVTPECLAYAVLDDGSMICSQPNPQGRIDVRSSSGQDNVIQVSGGVMGQSYDTGAYIKVVVSPETKRLLAGRDGSKDPVINYQMAVANFSSSTASAFGPLDYLPDAWLADGRVVADHRCAAGFGDTDACDANLAGTYVFSADGSTHSLLFKGAPYATVVGSI